MGLNTRTFPFLWTEWAGEMDLNEYGLLDKIRTLKDNEYKYLKNKVKRMWKMPVHDTFGTLWKHFQEAQSLSSALKRAWNFGHFHTFDHSKALESEFCLCDVSLYFGHKNGAQSTNNQGEAKICQTGMAAAVNKNVGLVKGHWCSKK